MTGSREMNIRSGLPTNEEKTRRMTTFNRWEWEGSTRSDFEGLCPKVSPDTVWIWLKLHQETVVLVVMIYIYIYVSDPWFPAAMFALYSYFCHLSRPDVVFGALPGNHASQVRRFNFIIWSTYEALCTPSHELHFGGKQRTHVSCVLDRDPNHDRHYTCSTGIIHRKLPQTTWGCGYIIVLVLGLVLVLKCTIFLEYLKCAILCHPLHGQICILVHFFQSFSCGQERKPSSWA